MPIQKKKTIVSFILDESGSMSSVHDATISGFNEYVATLKKDTKSNYEFTLTTFDTIVKTPVKGVAISDVPELDRKTYNPNGMTALYDAVCKTISGVTVGEKDKAIAIIMTDGGENSSREYTEVQMKKIIKDLEDTGKWTFVYLGANQDSYAVAQQYGFSKMNTSNYQSTSAGVGATMRAMASNTVMYAASANLNTQDFFSEEDQTNLENTQ